MSAEADRLIDQFQRAHDGDAWHGSPLTKNLEGITAEQAARRPPNGTHSIWELVLHATGWRNEVARRATGKPAGEPPDGDWPEVGEPTPARWNAALEALDASHRELVLVVRGIGDEQMLRPTNDPRDPALGGIGDTYYEVLHGIVQHDAYHSGQIAIARRVMGF